MTQNFNYAGLEPMGDRLVCLKIDENKPVLVSFLEDIPNMAKPPFVYAKVHWIQEMGENGRLIQCFGGACCEQVTWQKGWGGEPGKFAVSKPRTRYYIPVIHYEPDPQNPAVAKATVKYLDLTWTAFNALCVTIQNTEGISFFQRDILVTSQKVNGATTYIYDKRDGQAQWLSNAVFKQQVEEQLPTVAQKLMAAMPPLMTEAEFMEIKPQLDAKVQAAMGTHTNANAQQAAQPVNQYGAFPTAQPAQTATFYAQPQVNTPASQPAAKTTPAPAVNLTMPAAQPVQTSQFTQPQVNIPTQSIPQTAGVDQVPQTAGVNVPTQQVPVQATTVAQPEVLDLEVAAVSQPVNADTPAVSLDFDPANLLK